MFFLTPPESLPDMPTLHPGDYRAPLRGTRTGMTSPDENVTQETTERTEDVLSPATPGAEGLPLPDEAVDKPSEQ